MNSLSKIIRSSLLASVLIPLSATILNAQAPAAGRGGGGGGGGTRGGGGMAVIPNATPEQTEALAAMQTRLSDLATAVTTARNELATVTFTGTPGNAGLAAAADKVRAAEFALASARATEFARIQSTALALNDAQVQAYAALISRGGMVAVGRAGVTGAVPLPGAGSAK